MNLNIASLFAQLTQALSTDDHPWRWPVLATVSPDGQPHARIVVLREFEEKTAFIYTDARTQKVADLRRNPACSLLFFDPDAKLQVRAGASAVLHHRDAACENHWAALNDRQRGEYQAIAIPGQSHSPDGEEHDAALGMAHFSVLELAINRLDILQLTRKAHIRHLFIKDGSQWTGGRIIA